jgi:alpha/beta superfamily hydrolase
MPDAPLPSEPAPALPAELRDVRNGRGQRVDLALHPAPGANTVALIAHGITSNKDRPYLVAVAEAAAGAGVAALRFSFAGNGKSEGRFEQATPSAEVEDLGALIDAARAAGFARIVCVGHSLGGAVGLMRAARDERVDGLVSLAGMLHVAEFMQRVFGRLRPGEPMRGRAECPFSMALAEDAARLGSLLPQAAAVRVPWLLLHGTADEIVPLRDSREACAANAGSARAELVELAGVDHVFSGRHAEIAQRVARWLVAQGFAAR